MSEHIISDEVLQSIQCTCYEAGKAVCGKPPETNPQVEMFARWF